MSASVDAVPVAKLPYVEPHDYNHFRFWSNWECDYGGGVDHLDEAALSRALSTGRAPRERYVHEY